MTFTSHTVRLRLLSAWMFCMALVLSVPSVAETILVLKSRDSPQYSEAVNGFTQEWTAHGTGAAITAGISTTVLDVPQYYSLDLRLAWKPRKNLGFSVVGQDLLNGEHLEFAPTFPSQTTEVGRSIYGKVTWTH